MVWVSKDDFPAIKDVQITSGGRVTAESPQLTLRAWDIKRAEVHEAKLTSRMSEPRKQANNTKNRGNMNFFLGLEMYKAYHHVRNFGSLTASRISALSFYVAEHTELLNLFLSQIANSWPPGHCTEPAVSSGL